VNLDRQIGDAYKTIQVEFDRLVALFSYYWVNLDRQIRDAYKTILVVAWWGLMG
jgi:hypothetical protein